MAYYVFYQKSSTTFDIHLRISEKEQKTLKRRLKELGVPFDCYCLNGGKPELTPTMKRFLIFFYECYISERGSKFDVRLMFSTSQACHYIFCFALDIAFERNEIKDSIYGRLTDEEKNEIADFTSSAKGITNGRYDRTKYINIQSDTVCKRTGLTFTDTMNKYGSQYGMVFDSTDFYYCVHSKQIICRTEFADFGEIVPVGVRISTNVNYRYKTNTKSRLRKTIFGKALLSVYNSALSDFDAESKYLKMKWDINIIFSPCRKFTLKLYQIMDTFTENYIRKESEIRHMMEKYRAYVAVTQDIKSVVLKSPDDTIKNPSVIILFKNKSDLQSSGVKFSAEVKDIFDYLICSNDLCEKYTYIDDDSNIDISLEDIDFKTAVWSKMSKKDKSKIVDLHGRCWRFFKYSCRFHGRGFEY